MRRLLLLCLAGTAIGGMAAGAPGVRRVTLGITVGCPYGLAG